MTDIQEYVNLLKSGYSQLVYSKGDFTFDRIDEILLSIKNLEIEKKLSKKVYSIANELLENINIHGVNKEIENQFAIYKSDNDLRIVSLNATEKDLANIPKSSAEMLYEDKKVVKEQIKDRLFNEPLSSKGTIGAGFGFITLKADNVFISSSHYDSFDVIIADVKVLI